MGSTRSAMSVANWVICAAALASPAWGQSAWDRQPENLVLASVPGTTENSIGHPSVIKDTGGYRMWYMGHQDYYGYRIGYATSEDGQDWVRNEHYPVFSAEQTFPPHAYMPSVILDDGVLKMWYSTWQESAAHIRHIGYATSLDGIEWENHGTLPSLLPSGGWEGTFNLYDCTVLRDPESYTYKMWYTAGPTVPGWGAEIGYAESEDGIAWQKHTSQALSLGDPGTWDDRHISDPVVVRDGSLYRMWYTGNSADGVSHLGHAWSHDGRDWAKDPTNPVLSRRPESWDNAYVSGATVLADGPRLEMWYGGGSPPAIGYATSVTAIGVGFDDVAGTASVADDGIGYTLAWGDYDSDGDEDLAIGNQHDLQLYRNEGDGSFSNVSSSAQISSSEASGQVLWADFDQDGDLDLYSGSWTNTDRLYRNNGDGTFTDVFSEAGGIGREGITDARLSDYDGDGFVDLLLGRTSGVTLFHNDQDGTFTDVTSGVGLPASGAGVLTSVLVDYDGDGDQDLYLVRQWSGTIYANDGDGGFTENGPISGIADIEYPLGAFGDYDNDGDMDLFVTPNGDARPCRLLVNDGVGIFSDITEDAGVGYELNATGVIAADFDNNGGIDVYAMVDHGNGAVFWNDGQANFVWTTGDMPAGSVFSCASADYDGDGDVDVYVGVNGSANLLYENGGTRNNWLQVRLRGTVSNTAGIGARVRVVVDGRAQLREVMGGTSRKGQCGLQVEFGLGSATAAESVTVLWPSGVEQVLLDVAAGQVLMVVEEEPPAPNSPPVAHAGADQIVESPTPAGVSVTLDGTGSDDPDDDPLTYSWRNDQLEEIATGVAPTVPLGLGSHTITLVVSDGDLESEPDLVTIDVVLANQPPVAVISSPTGAVIGQTATVDGSGSSDPDGDPLTYTWSLTAPGGSGASLDGTDGAVVTFVPDLSGDYEVQLTVSDGQLSDGPVLATVTAVTVEVALSDLEAMVNGLSSLNSGQRNSLRVKVRNAERQLDKGKVKTARNMMRALANHARSLIEEGVLAPAEGDPLIAAALNLMEALGSLLGPEATDPQDVDELTGAVDDLYARGTLSQEERQALESKLKRALSRLKRGKTYSARNELLAFIEQVESLVEEGLLTDLEGEALIGRAEAALAAGGTGKLVAEAPLTVGLAAPYPNPFNSTTTIEYGLPGEATVRLYVYSVLGQQVRALVDGSRSAGIYQVTWDGMDNSDEEVGPGVYLIRLETGSEIRTHRVALVK